LADSGYLNNWVYLHLQASFEDKFRKKYSLSVQNKVIGVDLTGALRGDICGVQIKEAELRVIGSYSAR
jgi:hypothetical protein